MEEQKKRTWVEVNLENIRHNYHSIREHLPEGCRFMAVVKADAYGHGAVPVAKMLQAEGADYLAVAYIDEAMELRQHGITIPILILGVTPPEYADRLIENNITQAVGSIELAKAFSLEAQRLNRTLRIHIKVDSGMSRTGFLAGGEHFETCVQRIVEACGLEGLKSEGIFTHFAVSDEDGEEDIRYTQEQFSRFRSVIDAVEKRSDIRFKICHCMNTGAAENFPSYALDMARPGLMLYGYGDGKNRYGLLPGMSLKTKIMTIQEYDPGTSVSYGRHFITARKTRMAVLGIGYADGLHRMLSGKCSFSLGNHKIPQCGNICMDMCMADVTDVPDASVGDEVEIFGENNSLCDLSDAAQTIPYELLCAVSKRVPRIYDK